MTGPLGFNQDRGWYKEKRGTHKANLYIVGEAFLQECATYWLVSTFLAQQRQDNSYKAPERSLSSVISISLYCFNIWLVPTSNSLNKNNERCNGGQGARAQLASGASGSEQSGQ